MSCFSWHISNRYKWHIYTSIITKIAKNYQMQYFFCKKVVVSKIIPIFALSL